MRVTLNVQIDFDPAVLEREARRAGLPLARAKVALVTDFENRLSDSVHCKEGVTAVRVQVDRPPVLAGVES